jgi:diguanylate cyclase (GGDEF)-like protein
MRHGLRRLVALGYVAAALAAPVAAGCWLTQLGSGVPAEQIRWLLTANHAAYAACGLAMVAVLATSAIGARQADVRAQSLTVLVGVLPWSVVRSAELVAPAARLTHRLVLLEPVIMLVVPVSFFVAIFGFQLFSLGQVVRKSLTYAVTVTILAAAAVLLWVAAGMATGAALGLPPRQFWNVAAVLVVIGLIARPLVRRVAGAVDRVFFPEKLELRELVQGLIPELAQLTRLDDVAEHVTARVRDRLGLQSAALLIADQPAPLLRVRALAGDPPDPVRAPRLVLDLDRLIEAVPLEEPVALGRFGPGEGAGEGSAEVLAPLGAAWLVPVRFRGDLIGLLVLGATHSGTDFDRHDLAQLALLARQAAAMLENARLHDLATTDHLTGLVRRQVFEERLELELARSRRTGGTFAVAMLDVDDFKRLNDRHGHLVGDRALRAVADALGSACRQVDLVSRWGGEEFACLLIETPPEEAVQVAEKLRRAVADAEVRDDDGELLRVTVSVGVRPMDGGDADVAGEELLAAADRALYRAKEAGKNRVEVALADG